MLLSQTMYYMGMPDNILLCNCVLKLTFTILDSYSVQIVPSINLFVLPF
jgi:hypothetical protein